MEALQFDPRKKTLSLVKTDLPAIIEKNEVIVKVVYAGVCGTDLHILDVSIHNLVGSHQNFFIS